MLTKEYLETRFARDIKGNFVDRFTNTLVGTVRSNGLRRIGIGRAYYNADKLSWFLAHDEWHPYGFLPLNGDKSDVRAENLRKLDKKGACPVDQTTIRALFLYHPDGYLVRRVSRSNIKEGVIPSTFTDSGYRKVSIFKRDYRVHRLIYVYHHGDIPNGAELDHIDRNRDNNRIENLRFVTSSQNKQNVRKPQRNSALQVRGVCRNRNGFRATIGVKGKQIRLGTYRTIEEAEQVYLAARKKYHTHAPLPYTEQPKTIGDIVSYPVKLSKKELGLPKGVSRNGTQFKAAYMHKGRRVHIGTYSTAELAHRAYVEAKKQLHEFGTL